MTCADDFTRASPHWRAAIRTNQRSGQAFEWTGKGLVLDLAGFVRAVVPSLIGAVSFFAIVYCGMAVMA